MLRRKTQVVSHASVWVDGPARLHGSMRFASVQCNARRAFVLAARCQLGEKNEEGGHGGRDEAHHGIIVVDAGGVKNDEGYAVAEPGLRARWALLSFSLSFFLLKTFSFLLPPQNLRGEVSPYAIHVACGVPRIKVCAGTFNFCS